MIRRLVALTTLIVAGAGVTGVGLGQADTFSILQPTGESLLTGDTVIDVRPADGLEIADMTFTVDGLTVCTVRASPWTCEFDAGPVVRRRHVRVVARMRSGTRTVANVHTRGLELTETVRVDAVQVPVIVRDRRGRFVTGLSAEQFVLREDGVPQVLASVSSERVPLHVVLAVDISASMAESMEAVLEACRRFLARLDANDTATILAFNDNVFVVAEREVDPSRRSDALAGLTAWGGTALHDATMEALDAASRASGRKGVVIFTDGDDRTSRLTADAAVERIEAHEALVYTVAFGAGVTTGATRRQLEAHARASGGRVHFSKTVGDLEAAFSAILEEMSSQYVLSYQPQRPLERGGWRTLDIDVQVPGVRVQAREGYRAGY